MFKKEYMFIKITYKPNKWDDAFVQRETFHLDGKIEYKDSSGTYFKDIIAKQNRK